MSRLECIAMESGLGPEGSAVEVVLMEPRPFRPFKSSEEYLIAMKEDLAEWLHRLYYPQLDIDVDNFMDVLEDGVALCKHANNVRKTAIAYKEKLEQQGHRRRRFSTHVEIPDREVLYRQEVARKSFFARDNVHNFIHWCRLLGIYECLLFETDDLVLRKNEKSFILCLLEVARRGAHFGMPAPMLVQFEKEIDREMAKENQLNDQEEEEEEDEEEEDELIQYGPMAQIVTNDLRSLDEMVRELVENCSCPSQFPMIRVSEGKYRIGDTKMLIFVRVLRNHVMVRVGGGWDTLSHYLEKHDPCRCRAGHRAPITSKLSVSQNSRGATQMAVSYERSSSPPNNNSNSRRSSGASINGTTTPSRKNSITGLGTTSCLQSNSTPSPHDSGINRFRARQRSPSPSNKLSMRQRSESPASPPIFQRTGSGRYTTNNGYFGQNPLTYPQQSTYPSPPSNLDSLESYDSGLGHGSPKGRRRSSTTPKKSIEEQPLRKDRLSVPAVTNVPGSATEGCLNSGGDSSSEMSDEGYRTACATASTNKTEENDERPDSSCTQASQSSSGESGVSLPDSTAEANRKASLTPNTNINNSNKSAQQSRIPFLGSLRGLGKLSFQQQRNNKNNNVGPVDSFGQSISRSNSITSETSLSSSTSSSLFHRDSFGRHSLRTKNDTEKLRPRISASPVQAANNTPSRYMLTWANGSRNSKRDRPALSPDLFNRATNYKADQVGPSSPSPRQQQQQQPSRSRSVNTSLSKGHQPRSSSTSPSSRRRYFGTGVPSAPPSPRVDQSLLDHWGKTPARAAHPETLISKQEPSSKMSPLLRNMLKDVEIDNDASILKKMEEIVNQYKARVEGILAAEGKTLDDEWEPIRNQIYRANEADAIRSSSAVTNPIVRRNSFDSSLSPSTRNYPLRKDTTSPSPSKIPVPLFSYRSKETCL